MKVVSRAEAKRLRRDVLTTEDDGTSNAVPKLESRGVRQEGGHEAKDDQDPKSTKEIWRPGGEVIFALAGKQRQEDEYRSSEDECLQHDPAAVEARYHTDRVCLQSSKASQEDQVRGIALPFPEGKEHEADGAKQADPHHPLVALDPLLI